MNKNHRIWFLSMLLICAMVLFVSGCGKVFTENSGNSSAAPTTTATTSTTIAGGREYFPNTDGYSWTYKITTTYPSGSQTIATSENTFCGITTIGGIVVQVLRSWNYGHSEDVYLKVTDTAVLNYGIGAYPTTEAGTVFVFPLAVGNAWSPFPGFPVTYEVVALEDVTVPAGTFNNCFKIRMTTPTDSNDQWLAPNVGWIKSSSNYSGTVNISELTSRNF